MTQIKELKKHLKEGNVYRRGELSRWTNSIDKQIRKLLEEGFLEKISWGIYHVPKTSAFGKVPPDECKLIRSFLKSDRFLFVSSNFYNALGIGTTQLYNKITVYNHKRHGKIKLGNREFEFQIKNDFPSKITNEFLLIDLANNLEKLAEDPDKVLNKLLIKTFQIPHQKIKKTILKYANSRTKQMLNHLLEDHSKLGIAVHRTNETKDWK